MKKGYSNLGVGLAIMTALLMVVFIQIPAHAAEVWSDDFDDGNYDGWTVGMGEWTVTDGYLVADFETYLQHGIYTDSSQVQGTWSFDVRQGSNIPEGGTYVLFILNGTNPPDDSVGYGIHIKGRSVHLVKQDGGMPSIGSIGFQVFENYGLTWTHIDVTRNSTGGFHVYVNATTTTAEPDICVVDTEYSYSNKFAVYDTIYDARIDNIIVDDEFLITPPEPTTTSDTETTSGTTTPAPVDTTLLIVGGGVAVVVVILVVFMKRKE